MTKNEMVWDLSQLVESTEPVWIQEKLKSMVVEVEKFREQYHGKVINMSAKGILEFLEMKDELYLRFEGVMKYCRLMYSANSLDNVAKQLNDAAESALMKLGQAMAFVDIELAKLVSKTPSLFNDPALAEYRHFLERIAKRAPHILSEIEERLIIMKDKNGVNAWEKLQGDWLSTRTFKIEIDGEMKTLPYGKMRGLYQSPDRDLRKRAYQIVHKELGGYEIIWSSALRAVCDDHLQVSKLRKYEDSMTQSLIDNDVDKKTIESLMRTIENNVSLYQRYLRLKAKLMKLDKLADFDLFAPLPHVPDMKYNWQKSREEIVAAYGDFDREIGKWIDEMFDKKHIDGEIRRGKWSGAFCSSWISGKTAFILQSFNERIGDVYTQAHELGHAIHAYLGSRAQKPSNLEIGSCIAETGSIFGELLVTEQLLANAKTKEERQAILITILDEFGIAAFRVSARVFLEQDLYNALSQGRFLDGKAVAKMWVRARDRIFGNSVDWLDAMQWEWTRTPHYFFANYRFYNYPYVYAQLFVFALYKLYKEQGAEFVPKLKKLLAAGSSESPRDLAAEIGLDIADEAFWEKGMKQAEEFIEMLEVTL
ncbi:MAG: M3 family oligoendopeptidase [Candidatus Bathyarchaeota archaeon]|nr:MAG: M3 family oligoendopeptidase [Candidatus Bathyarchaeota archaeon]